MPSGRSLLPLLCYYFQVIWRHLKAARRLANSADQKRVLKIRDIPTLTDPSPPSHQRRLQSPPLRQKYKWLIIQTFFLTIFRVTFSG
jgi:hypothetical protein